MLLAPLIERDAPDHSLQGRAHSAPPETPRNPCCPYLAPASLDRVNRHAMISEAQFEISSGSRVPAASELTMHVRLICDAWPSDCVGSCSRLKRAAMSNGPKRFAKELAKAEAKLRKAELERAKCMIAPKKNSVRIVPAREPGEERGRQRLAPHIPPVH